MSNNIQQKKKIDLKMIKEIEVRHRPPSFEKEEENSAKVSYVHAILDKIVQDLNYGLVPNLDNVLNSHKGFLDQLRTDLGTEKSNLNKLVREVGSNDEGLIKKLNDLQVEIGQIKSKTSDGKGIDINNENGWTGPQRQLQYTDTELIMTEEYI